MEVDIVDVMIFFRLLGIKLFLMFLMDEDFGIGMDSDDLENVRNVM